MEGLYVTNTDGAEAFQTLVAGVDYPMFVVTTAAKGQRAGCLVGFAAQCSIDPVRFLVCISNKNHTFRVAAEARHAAVHFLGQRDRALAELFGSKTSDEVDKFARCAWVEGPGGVPLLEDCSRGRMVGRIVDRMGLGDHLGLVLDPIEGIVVDDATPQLGFQDVRDLKPGHDA